MKPYVVLAFKLWCTSAFSTQVKILASWQPCCGYFSVEQSKSSAVYRKIIKNLPPKIQQTRIFVMQLCLKLCSVILLAEPDGKRWPQWAGRAFEALPGLRGGNPLPTCCVKFLPWTNWHWLSRSPKQVCRSDSFISVPLGLFSSFLLWRTLGITSSPPKSIMAACGSMWRVVSTM